MGSIIRVTEQASTGKNTRLAEGFVSVSASVQIIKVLLNSCYFEDQVYGLNTLSDLVESAVNDNQIEQLIEAKIVENVVDIFHAGNHQLNVMATKILIKFLSGTSEQMAAVVNAGVVPRIIKLANETSDALLAFYCLQCLAKISNEIIYEELLTEKEIIFSVLHKWAKYCVHANRKDPKNVQNPENPNSQITHEIVFLFNNLCTDHTISAHLQSVLDFIPVLSCIVLEFSDTPVLQKACESLVSLTYSTRQSFPVVIDSGVIPRLVAFLLHFDPTTATAALGTIANIARGIETQIQVLLDCNVLLKILQLLSNPIPLHYKFVENIYMLIRNLAGGTPDQIQQLIDADLLPGLIEVVRGKEGNLETMMHATAAIGNMAKGGIQEQIEHLVELGAIEALCHKLSPCWDSEIIETGLDALTGVMEASNECGEKMKAWGKRIEDCGGLRQIEICQFHENLDVYQKAHDFIFKYFDSQLRKVRIKATYIDVE